MVRSYLSLFSRSINEHVQRRTSHIGLPTNPLPPPPTTLIYSWSSPASTRHHAPNSRSHRVHYGGPDLRGPPIAQQANIPTDQRPAVPIASHEERYR